ncbi:RNA polymerase sigma factor [Brevibacillus fluminis]|uniref:RNA polymerase sigma factor n=1 Tax=Brevibacillus fluminis TaxID=511487 RepID=UPI003F8865A9
METNQERVELIEFIYRQHYSYLSYNLSTLTPDKQLVEDIIQDVFTALMKRPDLVIDMKHVRQYLLRSGKNRLIDIYRKAKPALCGDDQVINEAAGSQASFETKVVLGDVIEEVLNELPESYRYVILARDYYGYSFQEIADATGGSCNSVKTKICRARKQFNNTYKKVANG